ncbi:MAG: assimilatory sulfite reductase (NADPH) flavoprotein subunit [Chromatiales bacterium]|nr:MAG: assimilatory sulfite reductase (NADPH) flavoprotein subunit [Chromatiales bacterium]
MSSWPASVFPLDTEQTNTLQTAVSGLSAQQLQWVSGYVAGLAAATGRTAVLASAQSALAAPANSSGEKLTVLYGSQTGNGAEVAAALVDSANAKGYTAEAISLADYKPSNLKRESLLSLVISTHGEGDPPDDAEIFHEFLLSNKAPNLKHLKYSVLALGDSSYVNFCQTGREFDARLSELGAERFEALLECDLDYDEFASAWTKRIVAALSRLLDAGETAATPLLRAVETIAVFDKSNPFPAEVLVNQKITGGSSSKDVRHIELSLEGSGLQYEPGDSLAVIVENPPQLVAELLSELQLDGEAVVTVRGDDVILIDALTKTLEITALSLGFLRDWSALGGDDKLAAMLDAGDPQTLGEFVDNHQIIDVVRQHPATVDANQFAGMLRRLSPRSYSIASSLAANPDEVHLTVAAVRYDAFGREHWGAASTHLADRLKAGDTVYVFVERNSRFRLPEANTPVVMIGPGTGVAPFRAFMQQRIEQGATGDNWLFFGDRNFASDFLYQLEWQRFRKQGLLQRFDVAFSRDQRRKIYVQDRIRENGAELNRWIANGAVIYVCGDAKHMANDVHEALVDVLAAENGLDREAALQKLKALRSEGRYQRDIY